MQLIAVAKSACAVRLTIQRPLDLAVRHDFLELRLSAAEFIWLRGTSASSVCARSLIDQRLTILFPVSILHHSRCPLPNPRHSYARSPKSRPLSKVSTFRIT